MAVMAGIAWNLYDFGLQGLWAIIPAGEMEVSQGVTNPVIHCWRILHEITQNGSWKILHETFNKMENPIKSFNKMGVPQVHSSSIQQFLGDPHDYGNPWCLETVLIALHVLLSLT